MKDGNWIPVDKTALQYLPKNRSYTKLEALVSIQTDYDNSTPVTIAGYSILWGWSRNKVNMFFDQIGAEIIYPENTQNKQNQKGQIKRQIKDRSGTKKGQIRLIESTQLPILEDRPRKKKGQIKDRSKDSTSNPSIILDPNPNPKDNIYCSVIEYLNQKTGKNFKSDSKETRKFINARLNAGFTEQDFHTVIDNKCAKWLTDPKMIEYLRPQTLFGTKFESYLQDIPHPLQGKVSDTTIQNIEVLKEWTPPE